MAKRRNIGIDSKTFESLSAEYERQWKIPLCAARLDGKTVFESSCCKNDQARRCDAMRATAIRESVRWGEPTVQFCPSRKMIWAAPLMYNAEVLGGLIASTTERRVFPDKSGSPALDIRKACEDLRVLAENANLTNAALLAQRREEQLRQRRRAEAIHEIKLNPHADIGRLRLSEEPALLNAVRSDDRPEARNILNRILVAIYHHAAGQLDLAKSYLMELVAMMCSAAVEVGGNSEELLGTRFASLSDLSQIDSEADLAAWLHEILERIMDSIRHHHQSSHAGLAASALKFIQENYSKNLSRDDVAEAVNLSPSHFSRLIRKQLGRSFTDLLAQIRVDKSAELLARTDRPLVLIALDCGFRDQSYFTKVFRRYQGVTPAQYRQEHAE